MTVRVQSFILAGAAPPIKTFSDTFHRADQPFGLGDLWALNPMLGPSNALVGANIAASINVAGNQANFSLCSTNGVNFLQCFPIPISWNIFYTKSQFSQARITADNSGGAVFAFNGPSVLMNANKSTGYFIQTNTPDGGTTNVLGKYSVIGVNGSGAQLLISTNQNFAINDVLRIEGVIGSTGTTINTYRNGVLQTSALDSTGKFASGTCGIFDYFVSAGVTQSWDNYTGGGL